MNSYSNFQGPIFVFSFFGFHHRSPWAYTDDESEQKDSHNLDSNLFTSRKFADAHSSSESSKTSIFRWSTIFHVHLRILVPHLFIHMMAGAGVLIGELIDGPEIFTDRACEIQNISSFRFNWDEFVEWALWEMAFSTIHKQILFYSSYFLRGRQSS